MPTVLITGITAFTSVHVALVFLRNGWTVRGTLRSDSKRASILAIPELAPYLSKLEFAITGDLATVKAEDLAEAVRGVDAVVHIASPVEFEGHDFQKIFLAPALNGTRAVLEAAAKEEGIKAVVMTSTYGAMCDTRHHPTDLAGKVVDENTWNPDTIEELTEMGKKQSPGNGIYPSGFLYYMGAKKYSEKAAWEIKEKSGAKWSLAVINPTMIYGPAVAPIRSLSNNGISVSIPYGVLNNAKDAVGLSMELFPYYVDAREVAEAHYQAVVRKASGRFLLATPEPYDYQKFVDTVRKLFPEQTKDRVQEGTPGEYVTKAPTLDTSRSTQILGIKYRPFEETVKDSFQRYFELEAQGYN